MYPGKYARFLVCACSCAPLLGRGVREGSGLGIKQEGAVRVALLVVKRRGEEDGLSEGEPGETEHRRLVELAGDLVKLGSLILSCRNARPLASESNAFPWLGAFLGIGLRYWGDVCL